jgi:drug/metabolite transporter (DMT)-like permease
MVFMPHRISPRVLVLLALLTLVWGTNWPLFSYATREVSVWTFRAITLAAAGAVLLGVAHLRGLSLVVPRGQRLTLVAAAVTYLVVWNIASTYSALMIPSGQAALLGFTMPLWAALITWALFGEKLSGRLLLAMALGAVGVGLLMWRSREAYAQAPLGVALGLLSGVGWAVGTLILKKRAIDVPVMVLAGWQIIVAAVPITIGALWMGDHQWFVPSATTVAVIAYIALVPMCVGNMTWFSIVGLLPANVAGLSSILIPVVAMFAGALVHQEPLGPLQWAAMLCCVSSLALALLKPAPVPRAAE